jgi:ligand-binding sensor protein
MMYYYLVVDFHPYKIRVQLINFDVNVVLAYQTIAFVILRKFLLEENQEIIKIRNRLF